MFGKVVFFVKEGVLRKWVVHFFLGGGGVEGLGDCYCMILLDALEGCPKNPIKIFFLNTLLLDAKTEKHETQKRQNKLHLFLGGLKSRQAVVPLFPKKRRSFKILKDPICIVFPEKVGGGHFFFQKGLCYKEDTFRGAKK